MSKAGVPETSGSSKVRDKTRQILWAKAAGRCQYSNCNRLLIGDLISGNRDINAALVAHIIAGDKNGPRGDEIRSPQLVDDIRNLMLLCYDHHRLIDVDEVAEHTEDRLLEMKASHEQRIEILGELTEDQQTHVIRYGAKIGSNESPLSFENVRTVVLPDHYPADGRSIGLELIGCQFEDHEESFWTFQQENLQRQFRDKIKGKIETGEIRHLSVFALAPQPLLIELGRLLCDICPANIHQLKREPKGWGWVQDSTPISLQRSEGKHGAKQVALKLALSATVNDGRIYKVLGGDVSIWSITADNPHNDIIRHSDDLLIFRQLLRRIFDRIKAVHGEDVCVNIFPALPVSASVEVGRVWMPKADLPLLIYDQNNKKKSFIPTLRIK
ncbi:MAG: SAVED domain-containing protein [Rhizobiales bacterium]|nr:SAVED domain-containing protein [Hyphomicrobiales bacterium]